MSYHVLIGDEPTTIVEETAKDAARRAAAYCNEDDVITVIGPRGGFTYWRPIRDGRFTDAIPEE